MSAAVGMSPLGVVLVDDLAVPPSLCGRPAVDWLLDTVEALAPASVTVVGTGSVAGRLALRPLPTSGDCSMRVLLPCSVPLLRPATVRRLVSLASRGFVVAALDRPSPWWADDAGTESGPVVIAGDFDPSAASPGPPTIRIDGPEALWLNDPVDRVRAENALYERIALGWLARGVAVDDPATTRIDATVRIGEGARIRPNTELVGDTVIGRGSRIGPTTTVRDSRVGEDCLVHYAVCQDVEIGDRANVGPFTWLRSGTVLGAECRAGAFVELSDSVIGAGTEVPHLAGLFSADVGRNCNIASMAGSLNFNGGQKRRTRIGDEVSIGSGSILIAPVSIGDRAETAAGSVITEDVPDGALGMSRTAQRNVTGWSSIRRSS